MGSSEGADESQAEGVRGERRGVRPKGDGEGTNEGGEELEEEGAERESGGHWGGGCENYTSRVHWWEKEVKDGNGRGKRAEE